MLCILSVTNFAIIRDIVAREGRQDIQRIVSLSVLHSGQNSRLKGTYYNWERVQPTRVPMMTMQSSRSILSVVCVCVCVCV